MQWWMKWLDLRYEWSRCMAGRGGREGHRRTMSGVCTHYENDGDRVRCKGCAKALLPCGLTFEIVLFQSLFFGRDQSVTLVPTKERNSATNRCRKQIPLHTLKNKPTNHGPNFSWVCCIVVVLSNRLIPSQQRSSPSSCFLVDITDNALVVVSVWRRWVWLINGVKIVDECWVEPMVEGDRVGKLFWVKVSGDALEAVSRRRHILWVGGVVVIGAGDHHGSYSGREEDM